MTASNLKPQTSNRAKPLASVSLDLDNQWSYMKTHNDPEWENFPSYFETFIPMILDVLDEIDIKITFFIVGQDAAFKKNKHKLRLLADRGHEIGNHSYHHEPWLHLYSLEELRTEVSNAEKEIVDATGKKPIGFRSPGFSWSLAIIQVLSEYEYTYDASILPTYLAPLARAYFFRKAKFGKEEKRYRERLYGRFSEGRKPVGTFFWQTNNGRPLLEIPITTIPFFKMPFHLSYLLYLYQFSPVLMLLYLKFAVAMCLMNKVQPSFLLHPLDLLTDQEVRALDFFPAMTLSAGEKHRVFKQVLSILAKHFTLVTMGEHATSVLNRKRNKRVSKVI